MRIALIYDLIYPYSKGGVEHRVADISEGLAERGHQVDVYGAKMWSGPDVLDEDGVAIHGIQAPPKIHTRSGRRSVWHALSFAFRLGRRLSRERYDVVDLQSMAPIAALVGLVLCRVRRVTCLVTWHEVWGEAWLRYLGRPLGYLGIMAERAMAALGDHHLAVSEHTAARAREVLRLHDVGVVEGGIDLAMIDGIQPAPTAIDVVFLGRLDKHKNVDRLLSAIELLGNQGRIVSTVVIGSGPCLESLQERADVLTQVRFETSVEETADVFSLLKAARLFVSPSSREGFGLAVLEALGCGVPVIVAKHPDNASEDLVIHGYNGLTVSGDVYELAEAIETLLQDEDARQSLADHAMITSRERDKSRMVSLTERAYVRSVGGLSERGAPRAGTSRGINLRSAR